MATYYVKRKYTGKIVPVEIDPKKLEAKKKSAANYATLKVQVPIYQEADGSWDMEGQMVSPSQVFESAREAWASEVRSIQRKIEGLEHQIAQLRTSLAEAEWNAGDKYLRPE